jgi:hypothetical protein
VLAKIRYRDPRLPDSGGFKLIPDPATLAAEIQILERQGFTIIEIAPPLPDMLGEVGGTRFASNQPTPTRN